jgi:hypothetical protein
VSEPSTKPSLTPREAKAAATGKAPRGKPPAPPQAGPRPDDQSRIMPVAGGGFEQCYNARAVVDTESLLVLAHNDSLTEANVNTCEAAGIAPLIALKRDEHHPQWSERFAEPPAPTPAATPVGRATRCANRASSRPSHRT